MTTRVMPPPVGQNYHTVNTRYYICAVGASIDVPDHDAQILGANGWTLIGQVAATSARPTNPLKNQAFFDTTLGYTIVWDGKTWRNPSTGAAV